MSAIRIVEVIVPIRRSLDSLAQPCRDCDAGEPHCCPMLRSDIAIEVIR